MLWQRIRIALLTGALVAMTGLTAWGEEDKDKPKGGEKIGPPAAQQAAPVPVPAPLVAPACPPRTCTIWVNEYVKEY
ncbi:MAG TPA: hypothetical protein VKA46_36665, partial [Gemmataceae bacterium]|nr:hypothetical protein [Gemmataceae bacterium]